MSREQIQSHLELGIAMILVGSCVVVSKIITATLPIFLSMALRFLVSSSILVPMMLRSERGWPALKKKAGVQLFLLSFIGNFLYSLLLLYGLKLTSAAESGIILGCAPILIGLISFFFLRESLKPAAVSGIILATIGICIVNLADTSKGMSAGSNPLLGNLLIFGAAVGEALWMVLGKGLTKDVAPVTTSAMTSLFGLLLFSLFSVPDSVSLYFTAVPLPGWLAVLYYGIATVFAYVFWQKSMLKVSVNTAGVFTGIQPISAVILAGLLLREAIPWSCWLGVCCIFLAIVLMTRTSSRQEQAALKCGDGTGIEVVPETAPID